MKQEALIGTTAPLDALTVGAIGILAYMLGSVLHEGLGHGGACVLVGAKPLVISSVHFECSSDSRLVFAGGTAINLLAGALFFALGRLTVPAYPRLKYFSWIAMTLNLYTGTGYFLFSGIGGIGDWAGFIEGLGTKWMWRIALTIIGGITYALAARISLLELRPFIGSERELRYQRAVRLTVHRRRFESQRNDPGADLSRGIDLRWHFGTSVGHELAQARDTDPLGTSSRTATHSQELAAGGSGLCGRDCFHRRVRPERPVGALKLWAPFSPIG